MGSKQPAKSGHRAERTAEDHKARMAEFLVNFGRNVAARRAELGMSQTELAAKSGLARPYLCRIENECDPMACNLFAAYQIAKALRLSLMTLCERD